MSVVLQLRLCEAVGKRYGTLHCWIFSTRLQTGADWRFINIFGIRPEGPYLRFANMFSIRCGIECLPTCLESGVFTIRGAWLEVCQHVCKEASDSMFTNKFGIRRVHNQRGLANMFVNSYRTQCLLICSASCSRALGQHRSDMLLNLACSSIRYYRAQHQLANCMGLIYEHFKKVWATEAAAEVAQMLVIAIICLLQIS